MVLPTVPAFWVSVPHHFPHSICSLIADFKRLQFLPQWHFFSSSPCKKKKKHPALHGRVVALHLSRTKRKEKKMDVYESSFVSPAVWHVCVMLSGTGAGSAPLWEESPGMREIPEWGAINSPAQMRQGEVSGLRFEKWCLYGCVCVCVRERVHHCSAWRGKGPVFVWVCVWESCESVWSSWEGSPALRSVSSSSIWETRRWRSREGGPKELREVLVSGARSNAALNPVVTLVSTVPSHL